MLSQNFAYPGLMRFFERISQIPRGSYNEGEIASYIENFAKERGLSVHRDSTNNVFVKMEASKGYENKPAILLQGHTDMVCEKNAGVVHDFTKDPLKLYEENGWIKAEGTTLGADNGVAVATMLYILDGADGNLGEHPAIECLFTASEEVGLDGVKGFDYSLISARRMINMDSADESVIIAGCAGGIRSALTLPYASCASFGTALEISVKGLAGGHSGEDINRGRANANKLLGRVLLELSEKTEYGLVSFDGGSKDNAIPREANAVIVAEDRERAVAALAVISSEIKEELCNDDKAFSLGVSDLKGDVSKIMDRESAKKLVFLVSSVANGIFEMNTNIPGLVEFSRNLGVVTTKEDRVELVFSTRSSIESQIDYSISQLNAYADMLGGSAKHYNRYPGWKYAEDSEIRNMYFKAYNNKFGKDPIVAVIHAGLECGIIKERIPEMDIISCGPVILDLHSPDEAMDKASFERFFGIILDIIKM